MRASDRPKALLFDLGRVLVGYDWTRSLERLAARLQDTTSEDIVDWMLGPDGPHDPYCLGRIDRGDLLLAIHRRFDPDHRLEDAWIVEIWCDMFEAWPEAVRIVDQLRGQAALGLVSNTNELHFGHLDRMLGLTGRFDALALSHEVGSLKPEAPLFEHALAILDAEPATAWFTDDLEENVKGAQALGLRAQLFVSVDDLRARLRALGFDLSDV